MPLADAIRQVRQAWGYSQDRFGQLGGWSASTVRRWEAGAKPTPRHERALLQLTGLEGPLYRVPEQAELARVRRRVEQRRPEMRERLREMMDETGASAFDLVVELQQMGTRRPET